jgi:hypothetical protein
MKIAAIAKENQEAVFAGKSISHIRNIPGEGQEAAREAYASAEEIVVKARENEILPLERLAGVEQGDPGEKPAGIANINPLYNTPREWPVQDDELQEMGISRDIYQFMFKIFFLEYPEADFLKRVTVIKPGATFNDVQAADSESQTAFATSPVVVGIDKNVEAWSAKIEDLEFEDKIAIQEVLDDKLNMYFNALRNKMVAQDGYAPVKHFIAGLVRQLDRKPETKEEVLKGLGKVSWDNVMASYKKSYKWIETIANRWVNNIVQNAATASRAASKRGTGRARASKIGSLDVQNPSGTGDVGSNIIGKTKPELPNERGAGRTVSIDPANIFDPHHKASITGQYVPAPTETQQKRNRAEREKVDQSRVTPMPNVVAGEPEQAPGEVEGGMKQMPRSAKMQAIIDMLKNGGDASTFQRRLRNPDTPEAEKNLIKQALDGAGYGT